MAMKRTLAVITIAALILTGSATAAQAITPQTSANILTAMHDEAQAYADYNAWANQAELAGRPDIAALVRATADQERDDHFALEAASLPLNHGNRANILDAISGETYETTTMYPGFAATAYAEGNTLVGDLFTEIGSDEAEHAALLKAALRALCSGHRFPAPPEVDTVVVVQGPALATGATLANLRAAMRGESFASAKYRWYAQVAQRTGKRGLAALFTALSAVELTEHYAAEANMAGLVGDLAANVRALISAETGAVASYAAFAPAATVAGDTDVAAMFVDIGGDEVVHLANFEAIVL
jgi:rubrerythrin